MARTAITTAAARSADKPAGTTAAIIKLAARPKGVTRSELRNKIVDAAYPWTARIKAAGDRYGYRYKAAKNDDRTVTHFLVPKAPRKAPAAKAA